LSALNSQKRISPSAAERLWLAFAFTIKLSGVAVTVTSFESTPGIATLSFNSLSLSNKLSPCRTEHLMLSP
jgi:hypothetical protein